MSLSAVLIGVYVPARTPLHQATDHIPRLASGEAGEIFIPGGLGAPVPVVRGWITSQLK